VNYIHVWIELEIKKEKLKQNRSKELIYGCLRITGLSLSNQSELLSPRQINISHNILPNPTIPEDALPRLAKSQNQEWPNPGR
jgi:hypothetical protein